MPISLARPILAAALLAASVTPLAAQKWQVQYFYDKPKSTFVIGDLQFPSATRGIAVGLLEEETRQRPWSVVTSDGGAHWQPVVLKETPISLFFLNENLGWMVTTKGLWQTLEAGKSWTKLPKQPSQIIRVYFLTETHGFAVGPKRTVLETQDGGATWKPVDIGPKQASEEARYTTYTAIDFTTPQFGVITGSNARPLDEPPRRPDFVDPRGALSARNPRRVNITLSTDNGGATWKPHPAASFGAITRVRLGKQTVGLGLLRYGESYSYPAVAYSINLKSGATATVYQNKSFNITDIWVAGDGTAYLSGNQVRGQMRSLIPSPVQVLTSKDLKTWSPMAVDYKADATSTVLAASDDDHLWLATNTGMILKLVR